MTENPVSNVNRVESSGVKAVQTQTQLPQVVSQIQANEEAVAPERVNQVVKEEVAKKTAQESKKNELADKKSEAPKEIPLPKRQTALRFRVDSETHDVTMMIVDRATNKVIATIPPEAIKNLPAGELFQYSA